MYTRILVAIDGSQIGERVLAHAIAAAQTSQARLMLMHVLPEAAQHCEGGVAIGVEQRHLDIMRAYWGKVMAAGVIADFRIPCGHPGEEICELALRWGAELILMGHRSTTDLPFDSMGRYVLDHAPCPLLILPDQVGLPAIRSPQLMATR